MESLLSNLESPQGGTRMASATLEAEAMDFEKVFTSRPEFYLRFLRLPPEQKAAFFPEIRKTVHLAHPISSSRFLNVVQSSAAQLADPAFFAEVTALRMDPKEIWESLLRNADNAKGVFQPERLRALQVHFDRWVAQEGAAGAVELLDVGASALSRFPKGNRVFLDWAEGLLAKMPEWARKTPTSALRPSESGEPFRDWLVQEAFRKTPFFGKEASIQRRERIHHLLQVMPDPDTTAKLVSSKLESPAKDLSIEERAHLIRVVHEVAPHSDRLFAAGLEELSSHPRWGEELVYLSKSLQAPLSDAQWEIFQNHLPRFLRSKEPRAPDFAYLAVARELKRTPPRRLGVAQMSVLQGDIDRHFENGLAFKSQSGVSSGVQEIFSTLLRTEPEFTHRVIDSIGGRRPFTEVDRFKIRTLIAEDFSDHDLNAAVITLLEDQLLSGLHPQSDVDLISSALNHLREKNQKLLGVGMPSASGKSAPEDEMLEDLTRRLLEKCK